MLKVINMKDITDRPIFQANQFFDNNVIFVEVKGHFLECSPIGYYTGIMRYDIISEKVEFFKFRNEATIISRSSTEATLYYASIDWNGSTASIEFRKVNCREFTDEKIASLSIKNNGNSLSFADTLLREIELYGINERYAMAAIPQLNWKSGPPHFLKLLLIDSQEKQSYNIPDKLGEADSLLRMDSCLIDDKYIIIKTGRIRCSEKWDIWGEEEDYWEDKKEFLQNEIEYFDCLENLVFIDSDTFIKNVKNGVDIGENYIVDCCRFHNAFSAYRLYGHNLKYSKTNFAEQATKLISFDIHSRKKRYHKINSFYEEIRYFESQIFLIQKRDSCRIIYDVINKEIILYLPLKEQICDLTDEYVITLVNNEDYSKVTVYLHSLTDNKVEKVGEGNHLGFDRQREILIIFNLTGNVK